MSVLDGYKLFLKTILVRGKEEWGLGREQNCKLLYLNKKKYFLVVIKALWVRILHRACTYQQNI